jgi:hypothetical protein
LSNEAGEFRILTLDEVRALAPAQRARYLGELARRSLEENMRVYAAESPQPPTGEEERS